MCRDSFLVKLQALISKLFKYILKTPILRMPFFFKDHLMATKTLYLKEGGFNRLALPKLGSTFF